MPLSPASRLGPYEIQSMVGAGGMGEVYRARDSRLERIVAIKVLPAHLADQPDLRQRFEREARVISSLDHPHICRLFDIGRHGDIDFLVMEFLDGETLSARLHKGPLPMDLAFRYAIQIADALDEAHRRGVVHRDLKPGNIMLTRGGVKVLDFSLAKMRVPQDSDLTQVTPLTREGKVMGTLQYMAPETLEGQETDARTDIFAFGAVIYEMVTGRKAFEGKNQASIYKAILTSDPPGMATLQPLTPFSLDHVVKRALAKSPDDRWQTARDMAGELRWIAETTSQEAIGAMTPAAGRKVRRPLSWVSTAIASAAAIVMAALYFFRPSVQPPMARFMVYPPENTSLVGSIAVSPDGGQLAFVTSTPEGKSSLWVQPINSLQARALPGTDGAFHPFWSPDSRSLGFFAAGKLKTIRVAGGPPQALCDVFYARGGAWNREGVIVFSRNVGEPLHRIPDSGGVPAPVTSLDPTHQESSHQWPQFLPDSRHFLYLAWTGQPEARGIYLGSLDPTEPRKRVLGSDWRVAFASGSGTAGHLLFLRDSTLMSQSFNPDAARLIGEPAPVGTQVWYDATTPGLAAFSVSATGVLAYRTGATRTTRLVWVDRLGKRLSTVSPQGAFDNPWLSPDERRVTVGLTNPQTGTNDVWLFELSRGAIPSRFTFHPSDDAFPLWSPDGRWIVFSSTRDGAPNLYLKDASTGGSEEPLLRSSFSKYATDWSRDGQYVVFANWDPKTNWDLWILPMKGERKPFPYLQTEFDAFQATFSPDGKWIAYTSNESGRYEVYVQAFPKPSGKWLVSTAGGLQPRWHRDGRELFYLAIDRKLMAVEVKAGAGFETGAPRPLFTAQVTGVEDARNHYVVSSDGQRFLLSTVEEAVGAPIAVALNWTVELKK